MQGFRRGSRHVWAAALPAALVSLVAVTTALHGLGAPFSSSDEAILIIFPEQMREGLLPNRDFFTVYGATGMWFLSGVYQVLGFSVMTERALGLLYHVAVALGVRRLASPYGRAAALVSGGVSALVLGTLSTTPSAWLGGLALACWALATAARPGASAALMAGLLAALAGGWRYELGPVAVVACLPLVRHDGRWRSFLVGIAFGAVPTVTHLAMAGRDVYRNVWTGRAAGNYQISWSLLNASVYVVAGLAVAGVLVTMCHAIWRRSAYPTALAILSAGLLPQLFQRLDPPHAAYVACVTVPLGLAISSEPVARAIAARQQPSQGSRLALSSATLALLVLAATSTLAAASSWNSSATVSFAGRSIPVADPSDGDAVNALLERLRQRVPPEGRVFLGSTDMSLPLFAPTSLYFLLHDFDISNYYLDLPPGVAEKDGSGLVQDVEAADALVLLRVDPTLSELLWPNVPPGSDAANDAVRRHFCPDSTFGALTLYLRCAPESRPEPGLASNG